MTAWELGEHGVPHTVIVDNAGGHLMREGLVDPDMDRDALVVGAVDWSERGGLQESSGPTAV